MKPLFDIAVALAHLRAADPVLAAIIDRARPCDLAPQRLRSLFDVLLRAIVYQQLNGKTAASILARVQALFPRNQPSPEALLALPDEPLRAAGLSRNKLAALRDLAAKCVDGTVPTPAAARRLADADLVARLTAVRGVGPWTVHMLLMFNLGRPDVLPTGDFGVREGFRKLHRKRRQPTPAELEKHARRWAPYRSVAAWYLWRVHELELDR